MLGSILLGPSKLGRYINNETDFTLNDFYGSALNIFITGWIINVLAGRDNVYDLFGQGVSLVSQITFGFMLDKVGEN